MHIFQKLFKRKETDSRQKPIADSTDEETGYVCKTCGRFNAFRFAYCPACGTKRFSGSGITPPPITEPDYQEEYRITRYLQQMNLLHLADQPMQIAVQLENGKRAAVPLIGKQNSNDALAYLRACGLLSYDERYCFTNWPGADPCMGSDYHHISACVCELDPKKIYYIQKIGTEKWKVY